MTSFLCNSFSFSFLSEYLGSIPKNVNLPLVSLFIPCNPNSSIIISLWFKKRFGKFIEGIKYRTLDEEREFFGRVSKLIICSLFEKLSNFFRILLLFLNEFFLFIKLVLLFISWVRELTSTIFELTISLVCFGLQHLYKFWKIKILILQR